MTAEIGEVIDGGDDAGEAFVKLRAGFPAIGKSFGSGTDLVRTEAEELIALAEDAAHVRAEEFIRRAGKKIAIESANVNRAVRGVMHCVDEGERAGGVGKVNDFGDGIDGADGVGGIADGDEFRARSDFAAQVVHVENTFGLADV